MLFARGVDQERNDEENCKVWAHSGDCLAKAEYMSVMCYEYCNPVEFRFTENC